LKADKGMTYKMGEAEKQTIIIGELLAQNDLAVIEE
jgi:hypothetical protein